MTVLHGRIGITVNDKVSDFFLNGLKILNMVLLIEIRLSVSAEGFLLSLADINETLMSDKLGLVLALIQILLHGSG